MSESPLFHFKMSSLFSFQRNIKVSEHVIEHLLDRSMLDAFLHIGFTKEECVQVPSSAVSLEG